MKVYGKEYLLKNPGFLTVVNGALALALIAALLFFINDAVSMSSGARKRTPKVSNSPSTALRHDFQDYAVILKNNPFGFFAGELKPLSGQTHTAPSNVSLVGTVSGAKGGGYAIFSDKSGVQEVFGVGAEVYGLGRLERVEKDRVFIAGGGGRMEIVMEEALPPGNAQAGAFSGQRAQEASGFARRASDGSYAVDKARLQHAIENMNDVMTDARLMPYMVEGKQGGFMINEMKPGGVFQSMGLQNGDILLRVNEFNISNAEAALQAFSALKGMDRVSLDIIRNGSKTTMTYQIR